MEIRNYRIFNILLDGDSHTIVEVSNGGVFAEDLNYGQISPISGFTHVKDYLPGGSLHLGKNMEEVEKKLIQKKEECKKYEMKGKSLWEIFKEWWKAL